MLMRKFLLLTPLCLLAACGNGDNPPSDPTPADIQLETSSVNWEEGALSCVITARVIDADSQPLQGIDRAAYT